MSLQSEYLALRKKRLEQNATANTGSAKVSSGSTKASSGSTKVSSGGTKKSSGSIQSTTTKTSSVGAKRESFLDEYLRLREERIARETQEQKEKLTTQERLMRGDDIAPVKAEAKEDDSGWFTAPTYFDDGYDFGDITKTILGTGGDIIENLSTGVVGMGEKIVDALATIAPYMTESMAAQTGGYYNYEAAQMRMEMMEDSKTELQKFVEKDLYNEQELVKSASTAILNGKDVDDYSVMGEKSDTLVQSGGELAVTAGLSAVGVPWYLVTGATAMGAESENALREGASLEEAALSGMVSAGAEVLTEKLSGGIKFGGKAVDDVITDQIARKISNRAVRNIVRLGVDAAGEGTEEVISQVIGNLGSALYKEENLEELLLSEEALDEYIDSYIGGALLGGVASGGKAAVSGIKGTDYASGLTKNEETVVRQVYNQKVEEAKKNGKVSQRVKSRLYDETLAEMEKGYISTDTIESILGGETYETYKSLSEKEQSILKEYEELGKKTQYTLADQNRYQELDAQVKEIREKSQAGAYRTKLDNEVSALVNGTRLAESYNERSRRGETYQADLSKYNPKQREVVQKAIDSGVLNNTNRSHELVDLVAKISADKGISFDFTNNEKLKESGFAVDGKTVNGFVTKDGITLNTQSSKYLNSVVGHEVTHVLEGTELYTELQSVLFEYAEHKKDYFNRRRILEATYKGVDADIDAELTADLVGDYLFSDPDFIRRLSSEHRNVFQKIYDEIKYLCRVATAGSKEARELEKVRKAFVQAYRESGTAQKGIKYSISETTDGRYAAVVDNDILRDIDTTTWDKETKQQAQKAASEELKKFSGGFTINGIELIGNKKTRDEYTRSNYSEALARKNTDAYLDKMRSAEVLDDVIQVATEWETDNNIKHDRKDYVDFVRGKTLIASGDNTYRAVVLAGITRDGKAVFYDVEDIYPESFELKKSESSTADSANELPNAILEDSDVPTVAQNKPDVKEKYSISDSDGKQLTKEQQEYFKDSKVTDENGNLKVMYHGSQESFTAFDRKKAKSSGYYGSGFYFTDSDSHAKQYGNTYEVYLNITNPLQDGTNDITKDQLRAFVEAISENEDYGIDNYGYGATVDSVVDSVYGKSDFAMLMDINATCVGNMVEAVELFNQVNGTDYNGIIAPTETVAFYPEQIKRTDNTKPTADPDIRFSLSEPVEETKDLIAVHNLRGDELVKSLELGGLPMPSIAVIKAESSHEDYGDVSLILSKDAIDPQASRYNKVYGGDAWTPTYPKIEYKPNDAVEQRISDKYYELADKIGYNEVRPMYRYVTELEEMLNRDGGEAAMLNSLYDNTDMMQVYLQDSGKGKVQPIVHETRTEISPAQAELNQFMIDAMGEDLIAEFKAPAGQNPMPYRKNYVEQHEAEIRDAYSRYFMEVHGFTEADIENVMSDTTVRGLMKIVRDAYQYTQNKGVTIREETDYTATKDAIRAAAADGYREWVDSLFKGVEEKTGIRNNQDLFDGRGNRRGWDALHWENTLENVVKTMRGQNQTGADAMFAAHSIFATSAKEYGSIAEIKADSDRLKTIPKEEYEAIKDSYTSRFSEIANRIASKTERNSFIAQDNAMECIVDAVRTSKTKAGILRELKSYPQLTVTEKDVADIVSLVNDIANMPTGYFEAKPQRAVGFDEVGVYVIPNNADVKLKQELLNRGYAIAEYDPNVEGDRQKVVNQFEEYKFSLSDVGEQPTKRSGWNIRGEDVAYVAPESQETSEVAPVGSQLETEKSTPDAVTQPETQPEADIAPVDDTEEMFPSEEPLQSKRDRLEAEYNDLYERYYAAFSAEDQATQDELHPQVMEAYDNFIAANRALEEENQRNLNSLTDKDAPPEVEAPYYEDSAPDVEDPFADRDWFTVGKKRSQKAYMYENPEVKPFFQEEATYILGELMATQKGERLFNGQLYYDTNGEKGWSGVSRMTSDSIAEMLDSWHMSYADIERGLEAIVQDNGAENNAASKKIEFMLNDRLMNGYKSYPDGMYVPPNSEYLALLEEKQITEYSKEAFDRFMQTADDYAPVEETAEDVAENATQEVAPVAPEPAKPVTLAEYLKDDAPFYDPETGQMSWFEESAEESATDGKSQTRKELHGEIIDNMKQEFSNRGLDMDKVLKNAKNLSTFATVDNTPQRVMEKALGYKEGQVLSDITVNKVAQNETEGIKWLNSYTDRKNGVLAQLSKQYGIKPGSKESAAAQMYAEGFYVNDKNDIISYGDAELAADFPNAKVRQNIKGLAKDPRIRRIYDETLAMINESRTRNAYPEIPRLENYFLHFRAMEDTFSKLGLPFNPNDIRAKDLPTDLNGVTADLKPGQPYFASAKHRMGKRTSFDLLGGMEKYLTSAKNQIYHIDDIQNLRALRNYIADTYGQSNGLEGIDELSDTEQQERIEQVYGSHLSTFAKFLNEEANILAGKTALIDRGLEGIIGRRGITFLNTLNGQVGSNMVGYNVSSSLTNFLPVAQTFAKTQKRDFVKAFAQTAANKVGSIFGRTDSFAENSPVVIRRKGADAFYRTPWQKMADPGYALMSAVDSISTELIARTKYNELTRKGMDAQKAHYETDKWVSRLMGDRSLGQQPQLYNSKMLGLITKFQLEVRNQLDSQFYDTIQEAKVSNEHIQNGLARNAKTAAKVASTFVQLAVVQHLFGKAFESVAGYNPAFDIIEVIMTACGFDDDEDSEDTVLDNIEQGFFELLEDLPYTSTFTDGGRIPISSALPIGELVTGQDENGEEKSRWDTLKEVAPYYLMPGGYGQAKKTYKGLSMFNDEQGINGSFSESGNLQFPIRDDFKNVAQAAVFGKWANDDAQAYIDRLNDNTFYNLKEELSDKAYSDGATDKDKVMSRYINSVNSEVYDLIEQQRELPLLNLTDDEKYEKFYELQDQIDSLREQGMNTYQDVSFEEFNGDDYARVGGKVYKKSDEGEWWALSAEQLTKYEVTSAAGDAPYATDGVNHYKYYVKEGETKGTWYKLSDEELEKQEEVTAGLGITPEEYWSDKTEYNFAYNYPEKYQVALACGGKEEFDAYQDVLWDIKADKDENGKSINGSRKTKVIEYINGLDCDYGTKLILFKNEYNADDTYNYEIIDYLNSREDISYSQMETILKYLGFNVDANGKITW